MTFQNAVRARDFVLSAEIRLDTSSQAEDILDQANCVRDLVDGIQVTDNPGGDIHMSAIAAAAILLRQGIDPIMHMTCRDRNRVALRSDLLGIAALGISTILVRRGERLPDEVRDELKPVYDWGVQRLIREARSLQTDSPFDEPYDLFIGTAATAFKPDRNWAPEKVMGKAEAGANFVQTQLCFDIDLLRHYVAKLVDRRLVQKVDVFVSLAALPNAESASALGQVLRGAVVPARIVKRLRQAADPELAGIEICAELLAECKDIPGVSGANLVSFESMENIAEAIRLSGLSTG